MPPEGRVWRRSCRGQRVPASRVSPITLFASGGNQARNVDVGVRMMFQPTRAPGLL